MSGSAVSVQWKRFLKQGAGVDVDEFLKWVEKHKEGDWVLAKDGNGNQPLHLALEEKLPAAVSLALLAAFPGAAKEKNCDDNWPLHLALKCNASEAVLQCVHVAWPDVVNTKNAKDETALYLAMKEQVSHAIIEALSATLPDFSICTAFLEQGPTLNVPSFLAWWGGDKACQHVHESKWLPKKVGDGETALHLAIHYNVPAKVTIAIADCSSAAKIANTAGTWPLHLAIQQTELSNVTEAATVAILNAWPGAAKERARGYLERMAIQNAWPGAAKEMGNSGDYPLHLAVEHNAPQAVLESLLVAWPDAAKKRGNNDLVNSIPLHRALEKNRAPAVSLALLYAWPDATKVRDHVPKPGVMRAPIGCYDGEDYPLELALKHNAPEVVVDALVAASPEFMVFCAFLSHPTALLPWFEGHKEGDWIKRPFLSIERLYYKPNYNGISNGDCPLHLALKCQAPQAVSLALLAAWPGVAKVRDNSREYPLHLALARKSPQAILLALLAAWPDIATIQTSNSKRNNGEWTLHLAAKYNAPHAVVDAVIAAGVGVVNQAGAVTMKNARGSCPLHLLAASECSTNAEFRNTNVVCFNLVAKRASLTELNAAGQTPAERAAGVVQVTLDRSGGKIMGVKLMQNPATGKGAAIKSVDAGGHAKATGKFNPGQLITHVNGTDVTEMSMKELAPLIKNSTTIRFTLAAWPPPSIPKIWNYHLIATFKEIALYKQPKHRHLSAIPHFQHWSTVSHAWCTPSAKLTALTVLLAGETYKRGLLPRLPMDCWYRILNIVPRHELRQGNCEPGDEEAALVQYTLILKDARSKGG